LSCDASTGRSTDLSEFEFSGPDLRQRVELLCGDSSADWVRTLRAVGQPIDAAAITAQLPRLKQAFAMYRRHAGRRFYEVDLALKSLCDQLRKLDEPLGMLLASMSWETAGAR
jgi:hypothetical protein